MTDQQSIQDVLFFPQMRPEIKAVASVSDAFIAKGIPAEYAELIMKAGYNTPESLKEANANKLFNDICGLRKKLKLEIPAPKPEDVKEWILKTSQ